MRSYTTREFRPPIVSSTGYPTMISSSANVYPTTSAENQERVIYLDRTGRLGPLMSGSIGVR